MADVTEKVITEWVFDPSQGVRGLATGAASLQQFEKMLEDVNRAMPGLPIEAQFKIASEGIKRATASAQELQVALKQVAAVPLGPLAPPIVTRDKVAELKVLAGQLQQSGAAANEFAASATRMNMALLGRPGGSRAADDVRAKSFMVAALGADKASESFIKSTRATNMMRGGLVALASQSLGTSSAIGQMAQSALFFAGGAIGVIAVAAAVLATAKAYEVLTSKSREAKKAHDDLVASFKQRVAAESAALGGGATSRGGARAELQTLDVQQRQLKLQLEISKSSHDLIGFLEARYRLEKNITEQKSLALALALDEGRAERATQEAKQAPGRELLSSLGQELAALQLGEDAVRRLTVAAQANSESERKAALAILGTIQAINAKKVALKDAEARQRGETEAIEASIAASAQFLEVLKQINAAEAAAIAARKAGLATRLGQTGLTEKIDRAFEQAHGRTDLVVEPQILAHKKLVEEIRLAQKETKNLEAAQREARTEGERMADSLTDIGTAAFGIADVGHSLGIIGDEAAQAISDVGNLADALAQVALSASTGNIFGAIAAGAGLIGGLIGGGPSRAEQLLAENNERLADLKASLDSSINTLGGLTGSVSQLGALRAVPMDFGYAGQNLKQYQENLRQSLAAAGMTVEEWAARIRQQTGLEVLDEKGRVMAGTLGQVDAALKILIEDAERLAKAEAAAEAERKRLIAMDEAAQAILDAARAAEEMAATLRAMNNAAQAHAQTLFDQRDRLRGEGQDPIGQFMRDLMALSAGFPEFSKLLGPLAVSEAGGPLGREAFRDKLLGWVDQMLAGTLTAEDLGLTEEAFNELLNDSVTFLDSFNTAVEAVTRSMAEQKNLLDLRSRIAGDPQDAAAAFQRSLDALGSVAPNIADLFSGLDLGEGGAGELRQQLLELFDMGEAAFTAAFPEISWDDFLGFLGDGATFLDSFNESVNEATKSMSNVPRGLNLALHEFQTQALGPKLSLPDLPQRFQRESATFRGTDGAAAPQIVQHIAGATIQIFQQPGESNQDLAKRVRREFELANLAKTGDPLRSG